MNRPVHLTDSITANGGSLSGHGSLAARMLASGFNIQALRPCADAGSFRDNAVLRKDEWIQYDDAVVAVARKRLVAIGDLLSRGLRFPVANALGVTRVEWDTVSDMTPAAVTMSGISESEYDRVEFQIAGIPLPIIHKDFTINVRALEASRRGGSPLDTTQAQLAARLVSEQIETILFAGATVLGANNPVYGYTTALNRNTGSVTQTWLTATGTQIITDILAMLGKAVGDNMYGPYIIYVPADVYVHLGDDFKAASDRTTIERLLAIPGIEAIRPTKDLTAPAVIMAQMTSDVVDVIDGVQPTTIQWETHAGFVVHFKVMAIMIPRVRGGDQATQSGIVHYS